MGYGSKELIEVAFVGVKVDSLDEHGAVVPLCLFRLFPGFFDLLFEKLLLPFGRVQLEVLFVAAFPGSCRLGLTPARAVVSSLFVG
jgi:hypothetical protein